MAKIVHYASLLINGEDVYGTAELLNGSGYLFRAEGERQATLVSYKDPELTLLGLCALAEMQADLDTLLGGPAMIACSREEGVQ
jgi:hypothetical protein